MKQGKRDFEHMRQDQSMKLAVRTSLFFILYYLYVWLRIGPHLIYHNQSPVFATSSDFIIRHLALPGDPIRYIGAFLSLSYLRPWLGALVITLAAWAICMGTKAFLRALLGNLRRNVLPLLSKHRDEWRSPTPVGADQEIISLHLLPLPILLVLQNLYQHPLNLDLSMALGIWASVGYLRLKTERTWSRLAIFWILSIGLFYIAGPAYVLFATTACLYEIFYGKRRLFGLASLCLFSVVPYLFAAAVFRLQVNELYRQLLVPEYNLNPPLILVLLFLFYPTLVVVIKALAFMRAKKAEMLLKERQRNAQQNIEPENTPEPFWSRYFHNSPKKWMYQSLALLILVVLFVTLTFSPSVKALIQIDYSADNREWEKVLRHAEKLPMGTFTLFAWHDINRALYHRGELPYRMFEFPQNIGLATLLPPEKLSESMHKAMKFSDLFYDLGLINEAEHLAFESLSSYGKHPKVLKTLVLANTVKGRVQAARTFLKVLDTFPVAQDWIDHYGPYIRSDAPLDEPNLKHTNSIMLKTDYAGLAFTPETVFNWLLADNPRNEMAFQYLMTHYLLTGQFGQVVANVPRLAYFGQTDIPDLYQQAVLMYIQTSGNKHPNLRGHQLDQRVIDRFKEFNTKLADNINDLPRAHSLLARDFGDTYWFYCAFSLEMAGPAVEGEEKEVSTES